MSAADPQSLDEFASIFRDCLLAEGQVPVTNDLFSPTATVRLFRQWEEYVRSSLGGGAGGSLYYINGAIAPGATVTISSFAWGPVTEALAAFGVAAFNTVQPAFAPSPALAGWTLQLPGVPVAAFAIPAAALAPAGWINSVSLVATGPTSFGVSVATNAINPSGNTAIPFTVMAGAFSFTGVVLVAPLAP